ncbi:MAG: 2-oxo acid dehydrogenase subunit E2 [Candidatus Marinimicrobia bacterium]|nr:2-oxo acid dehydrogenase subunit E2 [Candidatus Neomarinimicrobiota bacterium]
MRFVFRFPDIGEGITEGKIIEWYVKKGQQIGSGDPVVKMETDKVVTDIPSPRDGVVSAVYGSEGDVINVDDSLIEIEIEGVEGVEAQEIAQEKPVPASEKPVAEKGFGVVGTIEVAGDGAFLPAGTEGLDSVPETASLEKPVKILATPVARAMAKDLGIDIDQVKGSGPAGRVMKSDIKSFHTARPSVGHISEPVDDHQVNIIPLTQIRKTIARKMAVSKQTAAHMTIMEEVEVSELIKLRREQKDGFEDLGLKLTYLPFILKAVAVGLKSYPMLNSELDLERDRILQKKYYHIGIAVDTEDGLVVPVIRNVDRKSIADLATELGEISAKARERKLTMDDFKDGTFTITNYGSIGGTFGVPVINYPQAAILGVGRIMEKPVVNSGNIEIGNLMPLSMSVDHRIVDGGEATRFLLEVAGYIANPVSLLLKN